MKVVVIGGGAGGFFSAVNMAEKGVEVIVLEKSGVVLGKVAVSGGGRCNVTNALEDKTLLVKNYPRGERELLGVFAKFGTREAREWFESRGVRLKVEEDGRVFPVSNSSKTIVDFFEIRAEEFGVKVERNCGVVGLRKSEKGWEVETKKGVYVADKVVVACGASGGMWEMLEGMGYKIEKVVPSLFAMNVKGDFIKGLAGTSCKVKVCAYGLDGEVLKDGRHRVDRGGVVDDLLITHTGFSAPAILRLSSYGARVLSNINYNFTLEINWDGGNSIDLIINKIERAKKEMGGRSICNISVFSFSKRLLAGFLSEANIKEDKLLRDVGREEVRRLAEVIGRSRYEVEGKSTHKQEFVSCGGVSLKEVNTKTFESKRDKGLYFCGEVLDIDAVTGGFNFQNAWSTGFLVSEAVCGDVL